MLSLRERLAEVVSRARRAGQRQRRVGTSGFGRGAGDTSPPFISPHWFAVVNDLVGGWSIANVDRPMSELDFRDQNIVVIADFLTEENARHIALLLNRDSGA